MRAPAGYPSCVGPPRVYPAPAGTLCMRALRPRWNLRLLRRRDPSSAPGTPLVGTAPRAGTEAPAPECTAAPAPASSLPASEGLSPACGPAPVASNEAPVLLPEAGGSMLSDLLCPSPLTLESGPSPALISPTDAPGTPTAGPGGPGAITSRGLLEAPGSEGSRDGGSGVGLGLGAEMGLGVAAGGSESRMVSREAGTEFQRPCTEEAEAEKGPPEEAEARALRAVAGAVAGAVGGDEQEESESEEEEETAVEDAPPVEAAPPDPTPPPLPPPTLPGPALRLMRP